MYKDKIVEELGKLSKNKLGNPFPYSDTAMIFEDFKHEFSLLPEEISLNADFNDYCMTIAGSTNYVLNKKAESIPLQQRNLLSKNFFERFPDYIFISNNLAKYPDFNEEYVSFEKARKLLLEILNLLS